MKVILYLTVVLAVAFVSVNELRAGSVDALSNQSVEYIRTLNRNAATDAADAVVYNPAGVMKMENGLYANLSGQYVFKEYTAEDNDATHIFNTKTFKANDPSIIPSLFAVYKQDTYAIFAAFTVPAGGGKLTFDGGTPMVRTAIFGALYNSGVPALQAISATVARDVDKLEMESMYLGYTIGGAFKINDMFSVALGHRLITAEKSFKVSTKSDYSAYDPYVTYGGSKIVNVGLDAVGFGGIIGLNVAPITNLNVGIRFETATNLNWDTSVKGSSIGVGIANGLGYADGETEKKDLPAVFGIGVAYDILPELKVSPSLTYYFIKQAKWEHYNGKDSNKDYNNGFDVGLAVEYKVIPQVLVSAGYLYSKVGGNDKTWNDLEIALDSQSIALGARYEAIAGLFINLGLEWTMYKDSTTSYELSGTEQDITYTRDAKVISLGVEYKAL